MSRAVGLVLAAAIGPMAAFALHAQPRVTVSGAPVVELTSVTPPLTIRAEGFASGPYRVTFRASEDFAVGGPLLVDTTFTSTDSVIPFRFPRALPPGRTVYWRALVESGGEAAISVITGPRLVPAWLTLLEPLGGILDTRTPTFRWHTPSVDSPPGPWRYTLEVLANATPVFGASNVQDTFLTLTSPLQASTPYRWRVTATLDNGQSETVTTSGTFIIVDPSVPTTTLFYQNFPNPFPSPTAFATCFWFDIGARGAEVSLDILDLRGNPVTTIVPGPDGQRRFTAGRYGRGAPGAGDNCGGRFVWNGTARDGRTVPPGVYLARFVTSDGVRTVRRIVFRGR